MGPVIIASTRVVSTVPHFTALDSNSDMEGLDPSTYLPSTEFALLGMVWLHCFHSSLTTLSWDHLNGFQKSCYALGKDQVVFIFRHALRDFIDELLFLFWGVEVGDIVLARCIFTS